MPKYTYVVYTSAVPGKEFEYNDWYNNQHIPDVLKVPGFVSARRLKLHGPREGHEKVTNMALYELETDDPDAVMKELYARSGTEAMPMSAAFDASSFSALLYQA